MFLLPARLKLITGHKSWPAYQRQRQRQQQQQQQSWPDPQLATGCHAMTITSCSSYSYSYSPSSSSTRLLIRATCHACQRGQGCVLLQRIVAAASRCILTLMRRALAQLMTHPYQWSLPPPPPAAAPLLNATTDYQSGQVALQQRIKSLRFTFIWMGHLKGQRQLPTAT